MAKVVKVGSRGTSKRRVDSRTPNWAGDAYKGVMKKRKEMSKDVYVSVGRGTSKIKMSDVKETSSKSPGKNSFVSTGRGTRRRKVQ
ncbi:MAG: hypothetical protein K8823_1356 [Cenarchaeum symbiont of Oopsacas minuta]|nr:hypothetical protein [Cenarchaeum symbiont of Oopsacas minuta]